MKISELILKKVERFSKRSFHDRILLEITFVAVIAVIFGIMGVDGVYHEESVFALTAGLAWCMIFGFANAER